LNLESKEVIKKLLAEKQTKKEISPDLSQDKREALTVELCIAQMKQLNEKIELVKKRKHQLLNLEASAPPLKRQHSF